MSKVGILQDSTVNMVTVPKVACWLEVFVSQKKRSQIARTGSVTELALMSAEPSFLTPQRASITGQTLLTSATSIRHMGPNVSQSEYRM
jgi:hypothetical protein